jgi:hypothetical protein
MLNTCVLLNPHRYMTSEKQLSEEKNRLQNQIRSFHKLLMQLRADPAFSKLNENLQTEIIKRSWG